MNGRGDGDAAITLSGDVWPNVIFAYHLDGTLAYARYLDIPAMYPMIRLAAGGDVALFAEADFTPRQIIWDDGMLDDVDSVDDIDDVVTVQPLCF